MNDLANLVDWSRAQFALTAMYHWLFVPLTLGLSVIVAIMESVYLKTKSQRWLNITKFWMTLFGVNFAIGVATGIIMEFEFGTNWSNYSWFVGDIFGAPLAIEGLLAFFMESTFIAIMFFGWKKVSPGFHLASTWLTALGASLSAMWILIANAWMQYPVGMQFDAAQMRNVMDSFSDVVLSPVAVHKFFHTVLSGWVLASVFVIGVSCWFLLKKRNIPMAKSSIKVAGWVGLAGILITLWTGDGSAVDVARVQPMKLAAMEGLYEGHRGQEIQAFGVLNPKKDAQNDEKEFLFHIGIPKGLSILAEHDANAFVPGINNLIDGTSVDEDGNLIKTDYSYAERIEIGKKAHDALRAFDKATAEGNSEAADSANKILMDNYKYFGYGYLDNPYEAVPPVEATFYAFHIMALGGGYLLLFFIVVLLFAYRKDGSHLSAKWFCWVGMLTIAVVYLVSECGWMTAEFGRQPWIIESIMPTKAAISHVSTGSVILTFWLFAAVFTALLIAEVGIMVRQIKKGSEAEIETLDV